MSRYYISGCTAAAEAAKLAKVEVVAAYPITPQTHIVQTLSQDIFNGKLDAQFVAVESEHSAMSASVGASIAGARAFTASSSQGLAYMHEVLPYASGLRLPLVMAIANRSVASPVTIFADHQDSLPQRETGFMQYYCESCQDIFDLIIMAYKVAENEKVLLPVMVCFDGFFLSHISEPVEIPEYSLVDRFLPKLVPHYPFMDIENPKSFNAMAFPDYFEEFQRDKYISMAQAAKVFDQASSEFEEVFGRKHNRLETYKTEDADYMLIGLGSMMGTVRTVVDERRAQGQKVGLISIKSYRPFPVKEIVDASQNCKGIGVLDRDVAYGIGGIVYQDVSRSLYNGDARPVLTNFILGLGGRDVTKKTINKCFDLIAIGTEKGRAIAGDDVFWPDENTELWNSWKGGE